MNAFTLLLRFASVAIALTFPAGSGASAQAVNPYIHQLGPQGTLRFELTDHIRHPHFWWPRTLLSYRILFDAAKTQPEHWRLIDISDASAVPMQISDVTVRQGTLSSAIVNFFSELPSGGSHVFELQSKSTMPTTSPAVAVLVKEENGTIILDSGLLRVRVPDSRMARAGASLPGPIMALDDGKGWIGSSSLISPTKLPHEIKTDILDRGPLFARVRITYAFSDNATYAVTIRLPLGYRFAEMFEEMGGLAKEDAASVDMAWTDFTPSLRRGNEPIDQPKTLYFRGEDPAFAGPPGIENPAEEFYFRLAPVAADNTISVTSADFTDAKNSRAIGLAVRDGSKWDDGEYAIWASSATLAVRFRYADHVLHWRLPLASGTRDTIVAAFDPAKASSNALANWGKTKSEAAVANTGVEQGKSFIDFLNSRYGGMSLDVVKDWQLTYPDAARLPDPAPLPSDNGKQMKSLDAYLASLWNDSEAVKVEGNWVSPVSLRIMSRWIVPGFLKWRSQMSAEDRERVTALLLFHAYFASRENVSAMRHVLRGHPNFMADWKYPLMAGAFLFPDHPLANEWADQFEKFLEIMGVFHVRPAVAAWEAMGGRWTESIATYNWAFIQPATTANALGIRFDSRDRWPSEGLALHGNYLAGIVSSPVKLGKDGDPTDVALGTALTAENGFERVHPPQGAHSGRRQIPGGMAEAGKSLLRFDPLVGEHMLWAVQRPVGPATNADGEPVAEAKTAVNNGTNPRLVSAKYTGYGFVLRAAVDTPDEIAVYLQQIDKGPNYRWGFGNEGGCGDIYYYAAGKSFTGHLMEDAGDRRVTDAELTSNTGVYKNSTFRGIGMNDLTEPLYNLDCAQFAEILPRQGPDAYSWPEYGSRSVLLVGHDYIITFDVVNNMSRVSWNTVQGQDDMPTIIPIRGETAFRTTQTTVAGRMGTSQTQRFEPYKGGGDRMMLVTHLNNVKVAPAKKGHPEGLTQVITPNSTDSIFELRDDFAVDEPHQIFTGRAGVIRNFKDGRVELALFHGTRIGNDHLKLSVDNPDLGISAAFAKPQESAGVFFSRSGGNLTFTLSTVAAGAKFYIDGKVADVDATSAERKIALPPGQHRWQFTAGPVEPMPPQIARTEAQPDGAAIYFDSVAGAGSYRIERSDDTGRTWSTIGEIAESPFTLKGIKPITKLHLRVIALNHGIASRPGRDYPVYVTGQPPAPPAGMKLLLMKGSVQLSWGTLLGIKSYILRRRIAGQTQWTEVYRGEQTHFVDQARGVIPAFADPGLEYAAARMPAETPVIYEYAVSAVDGVGEGPMSAIDTTDPSSWRNWQPPVPLVFKRQSSYWLPPYVLPDQVPPAYYPR